jgi:hypothetical protein
MLAQRLDGPCNGSKRSSTFLLTPDFLALLHTGRTAVTADRQQNDFAFEVSERIRDSFCSHGTNRGRDYSQDSGLRFRCRQFIHFHCASVCDLSGICRAAALREKLKRRQTAPANSLQEYPQAERHEHLVVPHPLPALDQAEITDDAIRPVAHAGEMRTFEIMAHARKHPRKDALSGDSVKSCKS